MPRLRSTSLHAGWSFAEKSWQQVAPADAPKLAGARVGYSRLEWLPARVPGHVHLDLIENGVIGHPFERMQELGCQWVDEKDWSYRTRFEWHPDAELPQRVLRFEGLDTVCSVHLNDVEIARHDNMFVPLEVDVSARLQPGENSLRVDFESAVRVGEARRAAYFSAEGVPADCERFEERAFVRKVQCMFGWDWGPRLVSAGIWRPVRLLEYRARIEDVHVTQEHRSDGSVAVLVKSTLPAGTKVLHVWDGEPPTVDGCVSEIEQPELWYPHGLGPQRLFELLSFLVPESFRVDALAPEAHQSRAQLEAAALDVRRQRIGLRRLRLVREPDRFGESFELEANGRRFYSFGANWIPAHAFPSTITRGALKQHLLLARQAGMNTLRVWGGGLYESDDFYDLCDELGLVVWQDFPFACSYYPDGPAEQAGLATEARSNIVRLRNHASLALWCGNNENLQMFQQRWGEPGNHPERYYGEKLYDQTLPELLRELDPGRSYTPTSPHGGEDCQSGGIGDQHYWDVWHGRGDWIHYQDSTARFSSEYGFASAPSLRAFQQIFPNRRGTDSLAETAALELAELRGQYRDPIVRWHDKTLKGYETFVGYVLLHYPEPRSLEDWIYYSQLNQRDALRFAIEHYRRSEFCKGSLIWQLNDCWPVQSWALEDSLGEPKPALVALSRLYAPGLITLSRREQQVELWGILDNAASNDELTGTATLRAFSVRDGKLLGSWSAGVRVASSERKQLLTVDTSSLPPTETLLFAELGLLQAWCLLAEPKQLDLAAPTPLQVSLAGDGQLALSSSGPLVDLWLSDEAGCHSFGQNLLTLPTAGTTSIPYTGSGRGLKARSLAGDHAITLTRAPLY
jgi:beta-mannosidase